MHFSEDFFPEEKKEAEENYGLGEKKELRKDYGPPRKIIARREKNHRSPREKISFAEDGNLKDYNIILWAMRARGQRGQLAALKAPRA